MINRTLHLVHLSQLSLLTESSGYWKPPIDFFETDDAFIIRVEIAGMCEEDLFVEFQERILIIRGQRTDITAKRCYKIMQIPFGQFYLEIEIPSSTFANYRDFSMNYSAGFLLVSIPKKQILSIAKEEY